MQDEIFTKADGSDNRSKIIWWSIRNGVYDDVLLVIFLAVLAVIATLPAWK